MAKTGFGNFDYVMQGTWRGKLHQFHIAANHSGSAFNATDAETFMTGASSPYKLTFGPFQAAEGITCVAAKYYDGTHSSPIWEAFYDTDNPAPTNLEPTQSAFGILPSATAYPLEMCVMLESNVGFGSTGKPVYNRKFLRGAPLGAIGNTSGDPTWTFGTGAQADAATAGDGSWFGTRVYISPTGKQGDTWAALTNIGNHQIPRGRKRKTSSASNSVGSSILHALETAGLDVVTVVK